MSELVTNEDVTIYDSTTIDWTTYEWSEGWYDHYINKEEILKPYLIAYAYFNDVYYEDIILLLNNIADTWSVVPGTRIRIPKITELKKFILDNTK